MGTAVRDDLVLSHAIVIADVEAPFDRVDIAQWLKNLPTHEYQRCAPGDHKAAGYTVDDDGTPMSINVEMIGTGLVIQQYRFDVAESHYCRMVSLSIPRQRRRRRSTPSCSSACLRPRNGTAG